MTARSLRLLLERARARIEHEECSDAVRRSLEAALWVTRDTSLREVSAAGELLAAVTDAVSRWSIPFPQVHPVVAPRALAGLDALREWDDAPRTHADVLALYDAAISAVRSDEAMERA